MDPHQSEAKAAMSAIQNFYGGMNSIEQRKLSRRRDNVENTDSVKAVEGELVPVGPCETAAEI